MNGEFCKYCGQDFDMGERLAEQEQAVSAALAADREAALRDVFAAAALSGYIACDAQEVCRNDGSRFGRPITADDLAELAYEQADAMLKARKQC